LALEQVAMSKRGEPGRLLGWRTALGRELSVLLLLKAVALALLWWLFFSPAHRTPVDSAAAGRQLAVTPATPGRAPSASPESAGERR
jgi:hypothetical protein